MTAKNHHYLYFIFKKKKLKNLSSPPTSYKSKKVKNAASHITHIEQYQHVISLESLKFLVET